MKICLDARSPYSGGITTYTQRLLENLMELDNKNKYIILYDPKYGKRGYLKADERIAPSLSKTWRLIWDHTCLPKLLEKEKVDVYHSFKYFSVFKSSTKLIYTLHAAGLLYYGKFQRDVLVQFYLTKWMLKLMSKRKVFFVTPSEADKKYFEKWSGIEKKRIKVTYLAADKKFFEITDKGIREKIRSKYNLPEKFILYVGILHPIKNPETLIRAYSMVSHELKENYKLVIIGKSNNSRYYQKLLKMVIKLGVKDNVMFTGYIKEDLPVIYNIADMFILPSWYESFSLPLMEALSCGVPAIASKVGGIPEIYGDSVLLIDPSDVDGLAEAIIQVLSSNQIKESLRQKGLKRSKMFLWKRCALETLKFYEEVYNAR